MGEKSIEIQRAVMRQYRLTDHMVGILGTGHASTHSARVIGRSSTVAALVTRGLVHAGDHRWTRLGWNVACLLLSGKVYTLDELHAEALALDVAERPMRLATAEAAWRASRHAEAEDATIQIQAWRERVYQRALREGGRFMEPIPADLRRAEREILGELHAEALRENERRNPAGSAPIKLTEGLINKARTAARLAGQRVEYAPMRVALQAAFRAAGIEVEPGRWDAMVPNPHPPANCGPLELALPPGEMCPTCGTIIT